MGMIDINEMKINFDKKDIQSKIIKVQTQQDITKFVSKFLPQNIEGIQRQTYLPNFNPEAKQINLHRQSLFNKGHDSIQKPQFFQHAWRKSKNEQQLKQVEQYPFIKGFKNSALQANFRKSEVFDSQKTEEKKENNN
ncbi:hypothetical protein PPERSA_13043 [Pseudocohnilembus persalinus]|uniref:Uncharacterized protein n=1 Tax=Pseudocohnilembus persalinus TaxID=266149 RepID=A0A0V0R202_PSEPJ|nr:hypothetical protein PPERSA_13043 [Pseudocohnilembus persalinus]|eukprot:KRX08562.1 hypothetical protein PPERSA_13043 [Pseudocohnilembus persalinus]